MKKFGLIGYPLGHSFSKKYFTEKFDKESIHNCQYNNYPIENIELLPELIEKEKELVGLNVTIPYKQQVMNYVHEVSPEAKEIGAVNTLKIFREGSKSVLYGYNTDIYGFEIPLLNVLKPIHKKALILGTGGASKAVAYILNKQGISYNYVSRTPKRSSDFSYADLTPSVIADHQVIVNCSPIGMHPNENLAPDIPYDGITQNHILYDLIYNPEITRFLEYGKQKKAAVINGLPMLHIQAEKAWEIWNK